MPLTQEQIQSLVFPYSGDDPETDIMLFFTDNKNEPRSINIRRCIETDEDFTGNAFDYTGEDLRDFITACPRVPSKEITFTFDTDVNSSGVPLESDYSDSDGIIFAYQNVYHNGYVSSLSNYSKVAYIPSIVSLGAKPKEEFILENTITLNIPKQGKEVSFIRILYKEGDGGVWKLIDQVSNTVDKDLDNYTYDNSDDSDLAGVYKFRNNEVYPVLPLTEGSKAFDKLPKRAQSQAVSGGRLLYGNYEEGVDNLPALATSTVIFKDRLADLTTFDIDVQASIKSQQTGSTQNLETAFTIDVSALPDELSEGLYEFNIKLRPTRNIHLYAGASSYLPSKHTSTAAGSSNIDFSNDTQNLPQLMGDQGLGESNPYLLQANGDNTFTTPFHVFRNAGAATFRWDIMDELYFEPTLNTSWSRTGTTPASPLILDVNAIDCAFIFNFNESLTRSQVLQAINICLVGHSGSYATIEDQLFSLGVEKIFISGDDISDNTARDGAVCSSRIDLQLVSGSKFSQVSRVAELVNCVTRGTIAQDPDYRPSGFYIINKAVVKTMFESYAAHNNENIRGYTLKVVNVIPDEDDENSILTCLPIPALGLGTSGRYASSDIQNDLTGSDSGYGLQYTVSDSTPCEFLIREFNDELQLSWPTVQNLRLKDGVISGINAPQVGVNDDPEVDSGGLSKIGSWVCLNYNDVIEGGAYDVYKKTLQGIEGTTLSALATATNNFDQFPSDISRYLASEGTFDVSSTIQMAQMTKSPGGDSPLADSVRWGGAIDPTTWSFNSFGFPLEVFDEIYEGSYPGVPPQGNTEPLSTVNRLDPDSEFYSREVPNRLNVIDGDAGPGGRMSLETPFSDNSIGEDGNVEGLSVPSYVPGDQAAGPTEEDPTSNPSGSTAINNRYGSVWNTTLMGIVDNLPFLNVRGQYTDVSATQNQSSSDPIVRDSFLAAPINNINSTSNFAAAAENPLSFKTRVNHDFGIVYMDERGRKSAVNKLASVYVPGYSDSERAGESKGPVNIQLDIKHLIPLSFFGGDNPLRYTYKIYYSNKNQAKRFIQYSAAGAFVEKGDSIDKNKIYVSLNYLQGNKISYSKSYGARDSQTDEPTLYRFSKGDKLRVLSYYESDGQRVWAKDDDVFTVLGVETLLDSLEDHPLYSSEGFTLNEDLRKLQRNGQFVVLKNNANATGFSTLDIENGFNNWEKNCIFEIVSPREESTEETQPYFETTYGGSIGYAYDDANNLIPGFFMHEQPLDGHIIEEGDVFFRRVPVNFKEFSSSESSYTDLINVDSDGGDISESNFKPYHLETEALTDLHRSIAKGYGKPAFVDIDVFRKKMQSSVIFSDKTTADQFRLRHTSFPNNSQISFDLPEKHGDLNYIAGEDEYITTLQENKVAVIPVERSITSTAAGTDSLNISDKVLNSAKFYFGEGGPAGNPESVVVVDGYIYFADKHNKRISRLAPGGQTVENISDLGMEEYFRRQFDRLLSSSTQLNNSDIRIPCGFDPMENEFIVSFLRPSDINSTTQEGQFTTTPLSSSLADLELNGHEPFVNTISFDHSGGKSWKTRYSFNSTNYSNVNNNFISFKKSGIYFVWDHGKNNTRNKFHGTKYMSMIKPVSVAQKSMGPSATKLYNALSLEGRYDWPAIIKTHAETATISTFNNYEGTKYSAIPKSKNSSSTSNVKTVGALASAAAVIEKGTSSSTIDLGNHALVTFKSPVTDRQILLAGAVILYDDLGQVLTAQFLDHPIEIVDDYTIRYKTSSDKPITGGSLDPNSEGTNIYINLEGDIHVAHIGNSSIHGDNLRDKYATVMLLNNSEEEAELYSVNLEVSPSKLDPSS